MSDLQKMVGRRVKLNDRGRATFRNSRAQKGTVLKVVNGRFLCVKWDELKTPWFSLHSDFVELLNDPNHAYPVRTCT